MSSDGTEVVTVDPYPLPRRLNAGDPIDRDFVVDSLGVLAAITRTSPPDKASAQAFMNMLRLDSWTNWQFQQACLHVARVCRRAPTYADFWAWREEEFFG